MLQVCRRTIALRTFVHGQCSAATHRKRAFSRTQRAANAISLPGTPVASSSTSTPSRTIADDYSVRILRQKQEDLVYALNRRAFDPEEVWSRYIILLEYAQLEPIPAELHRRVLRSCAPNPQAVRTAYVKALKEKPHEPDGDAPPHPLAYRFSKVQAQLSAAGEGLMREDYLVLLRQYAAVGAHMDAARTLAELRDAIAASKPSAEGESGGASRSLTREYTLVLQALAFRLSLPCADSVREARRSACAQLAALVVDALARRHGAALPPACRDLALRVLKDVGDASAFTGLLARAGGVDLAFLDRHPLLVEGEARPPAPLTTAALTTIVDFFGGRGEVSKMVVAFEVLSTEYPALVGTEDAVPTAAIAEEGSASEEKVMFDDEDDEDAFPFVPSTNVDTGAQRPLPSARPNITTYNFLIRHCAHSGNKTLARHYLQHAIALDRAAALRLREEFSAGTPLEDVVKPNLQVNVDTLRPLLGLANREKDVKLIEWLMGLVRWLRKEKRGDFEYFAEILGEKEEQRAASELAAQASKASSSDFERELVFSAISSTPSSFFTPRTTFPSSGTPSTSFAPPPSKPFDLALHVRLLARDRATLRALDTRIGTSLARITSRNKERMGRRVWAGRDVFLADKGTRTVVSREFWFENVKFGVPPYKPNALESELVRELQTGEGEPVKVQIQERKDRRVPP